MTQADHQRRTLALLLASLAWIAGGVSTAVHFHGVGHVRDAATGQVIHLGCGGGHAGDHGDHHLGDHGHDDHGEAGPRLAQHPQAPHAPENCALLAGLAHSAGGLGAQVGPGTSGMDSSSNPPRLASLPNRAIELLQLAPKLSPPPARQA